MKKYTLKHRTISNIIRKHISTVNSFLDDAGHNRFNDLVEELGQRFKFKKQHEPKHRMSGWK